MSLFGSRDDDPLLQNDPLGPETDDGEARPEASPTEDERRSARPGDGTDAAPAQDRTLVYSREEAKEGTFAELNRALEQNWRLTQVQLREDGSLAFQLRRESDADII
jgi:hypothetical protein